MRLDAFGCGPPLREILVMSVEQIEQQIHRLPPSELIRFAERFNVFLAAHTSPGANADPDWQETPELAAELERRPAEFTANPDITVPFEPDYFEKLKSQLGDERAQKAYAR